MRTYRFFIPNRRFALLVITLLTLLLIAAQGEPPDLTDLPAVLIWLVAGGSVAAAQYMLSLLAELWPGWHNLPSWAKFLAGLLAPILLSIGANVLLGFPEIIAGISPWWALVVQAILGWLAGQSAMIRANSTQYNARARRIANGGN